MPTWGAGALAGMSLPFAPDHLCHHSMMVSAVVDHFLHFSFLSWS